MCAQQGRSHHDATTIGNNSRLALQSSTTSPPTSPNLDFHSTPPASPILRNRRSTFSRLVEFGRRPSPKYRLDIRYLKYLFDVRFRYLEYFLGYTECPFKGLNHYHPTWTMIVGTEMATGSRRMVIYAGNHRIECLGDTLAVTWMYPLPGPRVFVLC